MRRSSFLITVHSLYIKETFFEPDDPQYLTPDFLLRFHNSLALAAAAAFAFLDGVRFAFGLGLRLKGG